jgi:hypothetical protein
MAVKQQVGRLGKLFAKKQTDFVTAATVAATDALRHLDVGFSYNLNRQNSLEKKGTPGLTNRFSRHIDAGFDLKSAYLSPSGTIKTAPEAKAILECGFGVQAIGTGTTTVASAASSTVLTVQAGQGANFAVGKMVAIRRAANGSKVEPRAHHEHHDGHDHRRAGTRRHAGRRRLGERRRHVFARE